MPRRESIVRRALVVGTSCVALGVAFSAACIDVDGLTSGNDAGIGDAGTGTSEDAPGEVGPKTDAGPPDCGPRLADCFGSACFDNSGNQVCATQAIARDERQPLELAVDEKEPYVWFNNGGTFVGDGVPYVNDGQIVRCSTAADGCQSPNGRAEIATGLYDPAHPKLGADGIYLTVAASAARDGQRYVARCKSSPPGCGNAPERISPDQQLVPYSRIAWTPLHVYYFVAEAMDGGTGGALYRCSTAGCTIPERLAAFRTPVDIEVFFSEGRIVVTDLGWADDGEIVMLDATTGARKSAFSTKLPAAIGRHPTKPGFIVTAGGSLVKPGIPLSVLWFASRTEPLAPVTVMTDPLGYKTVSAVVDDDFVAFTDISSRVTIATTGPDGPRAGAAPFKHLVLGEDIHGVGANSASLFLADKGAASQGFRNGRLLRMPKK